MSDLTALERILDQVTPWSGTVPAGYIVSWLGSMTSVLFHAHWCPREVIAEVVAGPRQVATRRPLFSDGETYFEQTNV